MVAVTPLGIIAVLQQAPGCAGSAVYVGFELRTCVVGGVQGQIGATGVVVVARRVGSTGPVQGPRFEAHSLDLFDIEIVYPAESARVIATGVASFDAPLMMWNESGTHLLLLWPRSSSGL